MRKMFVGNLPASATEEEVTELFSNYGKVRSIRLARDVFSGQCRGFGFVEMEGHEARAAIAGLDGKSFHGNSLRVNEERPDAKRGRGGRR